MSSSSRLQPVGRWHRRRDGGQCRTGYRPRRGRAAGDGVGTQMGRAVGELEQGVLGRPEHPLRLREGRPVRRRPSTGSDVPDARGLQTTSEASPMLKLVAKGVLVHKPRSARAIPLSYKARPACCSSTPGCRAPKCPASRTTSASWASPLWQVSLRIRTGITCSGTSISARRLATARPAPRPLPETVCRTRARSPASAQLIPPDIVGQVPLDLLGLITGLPQQLTDFLGMALKSGSSSIKRMPRAMRRCWSKSAGPRRRRHAF